MKKILSLSALFLLTLAAIAQESGLKSYTLKEAVDYAIANNVATKNARLGEQQAKHRNMEIVATGLPNVSAGLDYTYYFKTPIVPALSQFFNDTTQATSKVFGYLASQDTNVRNLLYQSAVASKDQKISFVLPHSLAGSLQLTQLLFDARYVFGIQATKDLMRTSRLQLKLTEEEVKYSVTKAYYQARGAQEANALLQNTLTLVQKLLSDTRATFEQGLIEELDVDRLALIESNLKSQINMQNQMAEIAVSNLKFQMGLSLKEQILLKDNLDDLRAQANITGEPGFDVVNRVEFDLLNTAIRLKGYDMAQKRSAYYPSLAGFLNYGWTAQTQNFSDIFRSTTQTYPDGDTRKISPWFSQGLVGLSLKLPIFDSGMRMQQVKQAKLDQQKTQNDLDNFKNAAELQYRVALTTFTNALADEQNAKRSVELSEKIFKKNEIKFKEGVGSSFELEQSEQDFVQNKLKMIQTYLTLLNAKADLDKSLGVKQ